MFRRFLIAIALGALGVAAHLSTPKEPSSNLTQWREDSSAKRHDSDPFSPPLSALSDISEKEWTRLSHPLHPGYGIRVKKTQYCDNTVNAYTGYIDIKARHIFFYFFESRSDPDNDDAIMWISGGPGGSASLGIFLELGPCRITDASGPQFNPYSWNTNANLIFIDQPVGVGFSYAESGEEVVDTEEAARDTSAFVGIFFDNFVQFRRRAFHLAGSSYAGRYIPLFGEAIQDQNALRVKSGLAPINLASVMIGNGWTDVVATILSYYDILCTPVSLPPVVDPSSCASLKDILGSCEESMNGGCVDRFDLTDCRAAVNSCSDAFMTAFSRTILEMLCQR